MKLLKYTGACLLFVNLCAGYTASAQVIYDPLSNKPYYASAGDQSGNPLIVSGWNAGTILGENGTRYKGIKVNYDVLQKNVVFKLNEETIYVFNDPVKEFTIDGDVAGQTRRFIRSDNIHPQLPGSFVEALVSGAIGFYKHIVKSLVEVTEYNSMPRKMIEEKIHYYVIREGNLLRATLTKKSLEELFPSSGDYIRQEKLSPKSESDWIKLIMHLNDKK